MAKVYIDNASDLTSALDRAVRAMAWDRLVTHGTRVFLKPNLTYPRHRPGVTTSPSFIGKVIDAFRSLGAHVVVGEADGGYGAWSAEVAFDGHGLRDLCKHHGARLVNLSESPSRKVTFQVGVRSIELEVPTLLLDETELFVSLPVPKVHAMTVYSGAVKNQWGCIPDRMRLKFHPQFPELIWGMNKILRARLALGDGSYMLDVDGPMAGEPVYMGRLIASDDLLAFDVAVAGQIMKLNPLNIPYLVRGRSYGYSWEAEVEDKSNGAPNHAFSCRLSVRSRITRAAFSRQWAVNLLWFSPLGRLAHSIFYFINGNPIAKVRRDVEEGRSNGIAGT